MGKEENKCKEDLAMKNKSKRKTKKILNKMKLKNKVQR